MATRKKNPEAAALGRPSKRNPEVERILFESLQLGMTRHAACAMAGISEVTFYAWIKDDADFLNSIITRENLAEAGFTNVVQQCAAAGDWKAAMEWLKRRRRRDWCELVKNEVSGPDGGPIQQVVTATIDEYRKLADADPAEAVRAYRAKVGGG